jgi:HlyD family secretion protein
MIVEHMSEEKKSSGLKWFIVVALLVGSVAVGSWLFKKKADKGPEFTVARVVRTNITQAVMATGTLNPVLNVQVGSQISGIILKLNADFNSAVKAGEIIAELDPATYRANVNSAEGELANARASLELAQINARRAADLFKDKLISQSDLDQSNAALRQAEAQVKIRTASVERARVDLGRCTIYAPVDGIVIDRKVDVGQTVAASLSAPVLFQIANDLTKMQINAAVSEADVGNVAVGQSVEFTVDAFPFRKFSGRVTQVRNSPITVQNVVTYDTIIEVSNEDMKLKPGMTATVSIVTAQRENVLALGNSVLRFRLPEQFAPKSATNATTITVAAAQTGAGGNGSRGGGGDGERRRGGGERGSRGRGESRPARTIYTLAVAPEIAKPSDLKPNMVKFGISDTSHTEILEGLNEGDVVVTAVIAATTNAPANNPFGMSNMPRR